MASRSDQPRALVTGLGGFTGRYLAKELELAGYSVFGTAHGSEPIGPGMYSVDLCDRVSLVRVVADVQPHVVVHLAAISFVGHSDVDAVYRTNIVGSRNLLEALAGMAQKPRSVLLVSSSNVYGNSVVEMLDESVPPAPANDYGVSKLAMEYMARIWMDRLPIILTRTFNYTGLGQSPQFLIPKIVEHFRRGEYEIELGNIDVERDFSDVRMVARAYAALLAKGTAGEIFNVCSGKAHSLKDVLAMMAEIAGYQIKVRVNPMFVRANDVKRLQGSTVKLRQVIGDPGAIPLRDTLRWMYANA
ncbi:MAG: GDP-mannose 4,6-dehydratase [Dechloromonas sp.]|nr:GDP-mannose 4,6-dehydratase [Dechloromonas sp.]